MDISSSNRNLYSMDLGWKQLDQRKFTFITATASFSLRVMTYPMSLLKTNRQTDALKKTMSSNLKHKSESHIRSIFRTQGIRGFYKGITINLCGNLSHVVYATVYEKTRHLIQKQLNQMEYTNNNTYIGPFASGISGICASITQLCLSTPFDIISQKRMVLKGNEINTVKSKHIFQQIIKEEKSVFGLWRGLFLSLLTYAPTSGIVWAAYRYTKPKMNDILFEKANLNPNYVLLNFISGGIAGSFGGLLTMPLDTIKVRKQVLEKRSTKGIHIIKKVYGELGIFGFWRGVIPRTCQYTVTCAIIMTVYDWVKRMSKHDVVIETVS
eukprot:175535_1